LKLKSLGIIVVILTITVNSNVWEINTKKSIEKWLLKANLQGRRNGGNTCANGSAFFGVKSAQMSRKKFVEMSINFPL